MPRLILGLTLSILIAGAGYRSNSLTGDGALGAASIGTIIIGLGGWLWGTLLVAFFVSSSALSHYRETEKATMAEQFAKSGQRDLGQVLANGGWGATLAAIYALTGRSSPWPLIAYAATMAAVNADTWATELGVLNPTPPRLITTGRQVPAGTSGGVSAVGTAATFAGATFIGVLAAAFRGAESLLIPQTATLPILWLPMLAAVGGLIGSLIDSLLGATVQGIYVCPVCEKETESRRHRCGRLTEHKRGWTWLNNDVVNFFSSLLGSGAAVLIGWTLI